MSMINNSNALVPLILYCLVSLTHAAVVIPQECALCPRQTRVIFGTT